MTRTKSTPDPQNPGLMGAGTAAAGGKSTESRGKTVASGRKTTDKRGKSVTENGKSAAARGKSGSGRGKSKLTLSWEERTNTLTVEGLECFRLEDILTCGQCFRWRRLDDGGWDIAAGGHLVRAYEVPDDRTAVRFVGCSVQEFNEFWFNYFDLGRNYRPLQRRLMKGDPVMRKAVRFGEGIRILQQDIWETMVMFIISQNNNIPRIQGCVERLCRQGGEVLEDCFLSDSELKGRIPGPEVLAEMTAEDLAPVRLGYRAKYLVQTARRVMECGLPGSYEELLACSGIGPKVAQCIQLFGLHDLSAFPIDVWVMRLMHELYGLDPKEKNTWPSTRRNTSAISPG